MSFIDGRIVYDTDGKSVIDKIGILQEVVVSIEKFPIQPPETNDSGRFTRAFDYLISKGGGIISLPSKEYVANIKIPSNCGIVGSGRKSIIKCPNNSTSAAIELLDGNVRNIYLSKISIDGNKPNQTSANARGIYLNGNWTLPSSNSMVEVNDPRHEINDVFIINTKGVGFEIHGRGEHQIKGVKVMFSEVEGMILDAFDTWYSDLSSGANKKTGIVVSQNNCRLTNCKSWNNGQGAINEVESYGFKIYNTGIVEGIILSGCEAQSNGNHGFAFINARACVGSSLNSELNGLNGTLGVAGGSGFYFKDSRLNNIQGACRNMNTLIQEFAVTIEGYSISNIMDITSWSMKTGAINDLSNNKDNNFLNVIDVTSGEVKRYYNNTAINFLKVNNSSISYSTSPFSVFAKEGQNTMGIMLQKEVDTLNVMQELFRFEAYKTGDYNTKSRVQFQTQIDTGDININGTTGGNLKHNGTSLMKGFSGSTANRPTTGLYIGMPYFDTTLGKPVYCKTTGATPVWVDSTGTTV